MSIYTLGTFTAATAAPDGRPDGRQLSPEDQSMLQLYDLFNNFDWTWLLYFFIAAIMVFGIILLTALFYKRWKAPRLGFFLYTAAVFAVRVMRPEDVAWVAGAVVGVALSIILLGSCLAGKHRVDRKEPVFYILNAFSLGLIAMPLAFYIDAIAAMSLLASLFFITTVTPTSPHRYKGTSADPFIIESLEKRAKKR